MGNNEEPPSAPVFEPQTFQPPGKSSKRRASKLASESNAGSKPVERSSEVLPQREKASRSSKKQSTSLESLGRSEQKKSSKASKTRSVSPVADLEEQPERRSKRSTTKTQSISPMDELQESSERKSKRSTKKTTEVVTTEKTTTESSSRNDALALETLAQKEARSLLRRERRAREFVLKEEAEAVLRKRQAEEEAASSSEEEEEEDSGGTKIDANLSNQNNVTVNVPGLADIANAMTEMTKLAAQLAEDKAKASKKSSKKVEGEQVVMVKRTKSKPQKTKEMPTTETVKATKVKNKPKKIEEIPEEEEEVVKKVKGKSMLKKAVKLSESEEEVASVKKPVSKRKPVKEVSETDDEDSAAEDLTKRLTLAKKTVNKDEYEEADMEYFRKDRKRCGQPRLHLSEETTITKKSIKNWLYTSEKPFCQLFWEIVYCYPRYTVLYLLQICSEWHEGNMNETRFVESLWEVKRAPGHDGLLWFLTQYPETARFLRWQVFRSPCIRAAEAGARATGGRVYCLDPLGFFTVDDVAFFIQIDKVKEMFQVESREENIYGRGPSPF